MLRRCTVSYRDPEKFEHKVEVWAESIREAAVYGLKEFRDRNCDPEPDSAIELNIEEHVPSVRHTIRMQALTEWLKKTGGTPKEVYQRRLLNHHLAHQPGEPRIPPD